VIAVCTHWIGSERRHCGATDGVRRYVNSTVCPAHTPSALAGRPEPEPGPGMPAAAWATASPISDSRVHDQRAIASGKRRASPHTYKAARAAIDKTI
jgi:hypothetical protein